MGPQRFGTIGTDFVVREVQVLDGREVCEVGPQRFNTIWSDIFLPEVKLPDERELGQVEPQRNDAIRPNSIAAQPQLSLDCSAAAV